MPDELVSKPPLVKPEGSVDPAEYTLPEASTAMSSP
jgi:hypothetical protein